jgi:transcriptional regulator with XRE-family HTH domain
MNELLKQLREQLPPGGLKAIAERTNVSQPTVSRIIKGQQSPHKERVLKCAAEYITEVKVKEKSINEALSKAIHTPEC